MPPNRRQFIQTTAVASMGFAGLGRLLAGTNRPAGSWLDQRFLPRFGPLLPDPDSVLDLPDGFSYQVISIAGESMDDGLIVPGKHDGMGAMPGPDGTTVIIRNHEISPGHRCIGPFDPGLAGFNLVPGAQVYDSGRTAEGLPSPSRGGCTRLVYDTRPGRGVLLSHELALAGTEHNCAGGLTPHGTWLSCEESVVGPDSPGDFSQPHGYVFEVSGTPGSGLTRPQPIVGMGRMNHEAVAVDAATGIVYLTEDRNDGCLYRYIPHRIGHYLEGGRLEAMAIVSVPQADTRHWLDDGPTDESFPQGVPVISLGTTARVHWIPLDDIDPDDDSLRQEAFEKGAARFARGEGMWAGTDEIFFACTTGGRNQRGQIWRYRPRRPPVEDVAVETRSMKQSTPGGQLMLLAEPNDATIVEHADNLTVSPWGDLIVCEDGLDAQLLLGVTPEGRFYTLGRNAMNRSELAGATFSPDGSTLFVNIQNPGLTLAIRGPWGSAAAPGS